MNTATATATPTTEERVLKVVAKHFPNHALTAQTSLKELRADSLDTVEIVMGIEDEFDIEIADDLVEGITTVQGLIDLVAKAGA